jgi:iron(III) transport system ATP-binding protein
MKKVKVEFKNIVKKFNETTAVDNISCDFEPGTLTTLLGPSGCGKTTSLRLVAGLERATSGNILIDNKDVTIKPATDRDVSMVFQSYALFPHMSVLENVSYGLKMINVKKSEYIEKSINTLNLVGLKNYENRMPSELSGGQQQRVAVARAIVLEPKVLLFDEPLSNLDAKLRRQVREDIRSIQQKLSVTTIYVTHDQEEALAISDKVIVMNNAIVAQEGTPKELYSSPKTKFVANFIGDSNIIKVNIDDQNSDTYLINFSNINFKINSKLKIKNSASISIRPEKIKLNDINIDNSIEGVVISSSFVGNTYQYDVRTSFGDLYVVSNETNNFKKVNDNIFLTFDEKFITLLED